VHLSNDYQYNGLPIQGTTSDGHGNAGAPEQRALTQERSLEAKIGQAAFVEGSNNGVIDWVHTMQEEHSYPNVTPGSVQQFQDSRILESGESTARSITNQHDHHNSALPVSRDSILGQPTSFENVSSIATGFQELPVSGNHRFLLDRSQEVPTHPNLFVRGFPLHWTENDLGAYFEAFGTLTSVRIVRHNLTKSSLGYGFVRLRTPFESLNAIRSLDGMKVDQICLQVKAADSDAGPPKQGKPCQQTPSARCYVKYIPTCLHSSDLRGIFELFGEVKEIKIFPCFDRYKGSSALVQMGSLEDASRAIANLNGLKPPGSLCELVVRFAESKEEKDLRMGITFFKNKYRGQNPVTDKLIQQLVRLSVKQNP
jgi:hypothetical protein